jgi:hypothetical protein
MFVKFIPSSGGASGHQGLYNAIKAAGTAAAGETPAKPAGLTYWEVISNTEAGGWTVTSENISTSLNTGLHIEMASPSRLTPDLRRKRFRLQVANTNNYYGCSGYVNTYFDWRAAAGDNWSNYGNRACTSYTGTTSSTRYDTWLYNSRPHQATFWLSITADHMFLVHSINQMSFSPVGIAEILGADVYYSDHPIKSSTAATFYSTGNNGTNAGEDYHASYMYKPTVNNHDNRNYGYVTTATNHVNNVSSSISTTEQQMRWLPPFNDNGTNYYNSYFPRITSKGKRDTLYPVLHGNPWMNTIGYLAGVRVVGDTTIDYANYDTSQVYYDVGRQGTVVHDADGKRWAKFNKFSQTLAILAE